jgi:hypothetical protein
MKWALLGGYGVLHVVIIFCRPPHTKLLLMASNFNKKTTQGHIKVQEILKEGKEKEGDNIYVN